MSGNRIARWICRAEIKLDFRSFEALNIYF